MQNKAKEATDQLARKGKGSAPPLPQRFSYGLHFEERSVDVKRLLESLKTKKAGSGGKRGFQQVPNRERRRAASHNPYRIPWRYRARQLRELKAAPPKGGRKKMRDRYRRPIDQYNFTHGYGARSKTHHWFETHLWHAKRFHFLARNGLKIPLNNNNKIYRATYRNGHKTHRHCLMSDRSWLAHVSIKAIHSDLILELLACVLCPVDAGSDVGSQASSSFYRENSDDYKRLISSSKEVVHGARCITVDLYRPNRYNRQGMRRRRIASGVSLLFVSSEECLMTVHPGEMKTLESILDAELRRVTGSTLAKGFWHGDRDVWVGDQYRPPISEPRNPILDVIPCPNTPPKTITITRVFDMSRFELLGRGALNVLRGVLRIDASQNKEILPIIDHLSSMEGHKDIAKYSDGFILPIKIQMPKILGPSPNERQQPRLKSVSSLPETSRALSELVQQLSSCLTTEERVALVASDPRRLKCSDNRSKRRRNIHTSLSKIEKAIADGHAFLDKGATHQNAATSNHSSPDAFELDAPMEGPTSKHLTTESEALNTIPILVVVNMRSHSRHRLPTKTTNLCSKYDTDAKSTHFRWEHKAPFDNFKVTIVMPRGAFCGGKNLFTLLDRQPSCMPIGLKEYEWLHFTAKWMNYEGSGYDTPGTALWRKLDATETLRVHMKKPPSKRVNFPLYQTPCPFIAEWGPLRSMDPPKQITCANILGGELYNSGLSEAVLFPKKRKQLIEYLDLEEGLDYVVQMEVMTTNNKGTIEPNAMVLSEPQTLQIATRYKTKHARQRAEQTNKRVDVICDNDDSDDEGSHRNKNSFNRSELIIPQYHLINPLLEKNKVDFSVANDDYDQDAMNKAYESIAGWVVQTLPASLAHGDRSYAHALVPISLILEQLGDRSPPCCKLPLKGASSARKLLKNVDSAVKKDGEGYRSIPRATLQSLLQELEFTLHLRNPGTLSSYECVARFFSC